MRVIYKYPIEVGSTHLRLPPDSKILCVKEQFNTPHIWVEQSDRTDVTVEDRYFFVLGTGHPSGLLEKLTYIGTFFLEGGNFVGHLYEVPKEVWNS